MLSGSLSKDYADDRHKILRNATNKILVSAAV